MMDIRSHNRAAWDRHVDRQDTPWTKPVGPDVIAAARAGEFSVLLTQTKPVPRHWFPAFAGLDLLCLAGGGGQQGPVFAALGATVTVYDNSPRQLAQDRLVAEREGLANLRTVEGDAADLSAFADGSFDLVFNPVSTVFMADVRPVWREAFRVLRPGGTLLAGMMNPIFYIFDIEKHERDGVLEVRYAIPFSDLESLGEEKKKELRERGIPFEFGHSLTDLLAGQTDAGFHIIDFYEDVMPEFRLSKYHPVYIATRAFKP